jgi:membrane AbrB-like protein
VAAVPAHRAARVRERLHLGVPGALHAQLRSAATVRWAGLTAATAAVGLALDALGLPSPFLFGALLVGLAFALAPTGRLGLAVPDAGFSGAQAVVGVVLGAYLQSSSLKALGDDWLPVALVSAATLGVSLLAGEVTARVTGVDRVTAALGTIAGGASGITTMARELGGDDRLVAFMQYLRVLVVVLLTPVGIAVLFGSPHEGGGAHVPSTGTFGDPLDWLLTAALAAGGALLGLRARITAGVLLVPMLLTGVLVLTGVLDDFAVPALLNQTAFSLIGLRVGLSFTVGTVKLLGRLTLPVLGMIAFLLVASFGLAAVLAATTPATLLDAYLATTPGGLYAVLAVAFGAGANTTFIVAVQTLRVIAMVLLAPLAVRFMLSRRDGRRRSRTPPSAPART